MRHHTLRGMAVSVDRPALETRSRWSDDDAPPVDDLLARRVYTSRLLGADPSLTLHGGGNTSVKIDAVDIHGRARRLLYIKGSGHDLATIDESGFAPLRLDDVRAFATLPHLDDATMARELRAASVDPAAPPPSVETIVHALLPARYVDHTHPDRLLAVTNTPNGADRVRELWGGDVVVVPYVMPGFQLARVCATELRRQSNGRTLGIVLLGHGLVTFGETARESYERTIALVARGEEYLREHGALAAADEPETPPRSRVTIATLRRDISRVAERPLVLVPVRGGDAFLARTDAGPVASRGPATPDHVIRTKQLPLVGRSCDAYADAYRAYFARNAARAGGSLRMLDPAPRIVLDDEVGVRAAGQTAREATAAADIYAHTLAIVQAAETLGGWTPLSEEDVFDVEYWSLEQAKLATATARRRFDGEIALVTGAASGIGSACAEALLAEGAAVVGLDLEECPSRNEAFHGVVGDVRSPDAVEEALEAAASRFGGLDVLVVNAGTFPASAPIAELDDDAWLRVLSINTDANLRLLRQAHPLLRLAPRGGRVAVVGSKNVPAPGPGAGAYSASKAALTQLARCAALEWGRDGIRVNVVHPNAVFDTGIWTPNVLASRAASYGLSIEEYKTANVLGVEVRSHDVARVVVELCSETFSRTTGAQVAVDGGNERVI
jgi:rhamnose utilization protein RhaD (predicted bifunctional aldolase and dehydrogenase)/NAD(P)-dependent dehydrogenase (short-subunit alcohol dehydrogenase family)